MKAICIKCWNADALVCMDLDGSREFKCQECEERFSCEEVTACLEGLKKGWAKLLKWAEAYPTE